MAQACSIRGESVPAFEVLEDRLMLSALTVDIPLEIRFHSTLATQIQQSWGMTAQTLVNRVITHVNNMFQDPRLEADYVIRQQGQLNMFSSAPNNGDLYYVPGPIDAAARVWFYSDPAPNGTMGSYQYLSGNRTISMALPQSLDTGTVNLFALGNTLTHEVAHLNGALDLYCVEVDADEAIVPAPGVDNAVVGLTYSYAGAADRNLLMGGGDTYLGPMYPQVWDDHSIAVLNASAEYLASAPYSAFGNRDAFYTLQNAQYWTPPAVILRVVDAHGSPLANQQVDIYNKQYNDTFVDPSSRMDGVVDFSGATDSAGVYFMPPGRELFAARNFVAMIHVEGAHPMFVDVTQWNLAHWNQQGVYEVVVVASTLDGPMDFNGDGMTDIFWHHEATGQNAVWFMNGQTNIGGVMLPDVGNSGWSMRGVGDFNNDGQGDILWRNTITGETCAWFMSEGVNIGGVVLPEQVDQAWDIVAVGDFNGDGNDDIVWHNRSTGDVSAWLMSGSRVVDTADIGRQSTDAYLAGCADFNGDGSNDLLWRFDDGSNLVWLMDGVTPTAAASIQQWSDTDWQIAGVGDYTNNRLIDIFWRNMSDGRNILWGMNGFEHVSTLEMPTLSDLMWTASGQRIRPPRVLLELDGRQVANGESLPHQRVQQGQVAEEITLEITNIGGADLSISGVSIPNGYQVVQGPSTVISPGQSTLFSIQMVTGIAGGRSGALSFSTNDPRDAGYSLGLTGVVASRNDLSGNGLADLLWRHEMTGANCAWMIQSVVNTGGWHLPEVADINWRIRGVGDFNRDGFSDIVWRHSVTGDNCIWFMADGVNIGGTYLSSIHDLDWDIVAVADMNDDGQDDIIWQNFVTGAGKAWLMSESELVAQKDLIHLSDLDWILVATGDFNNDGNADLLWRNRRTGHNRLCYMNGGTLDQWADLQAIEPNWQVAAVDDYSNDGRCDIIWRNETDGRMLAWVMNNRTVISTHYLPAVEDSYWHTAGRTEITPRLMVEMPADATIDNGVVVLGIIANDLHQTFTFTLSNVGKGEMSLGAVSVPAGFRVVQQPGDVLEPGQKARIVIEAAPGVGGVRSGTLSFANNDPRVGVWSRQIRLTVQPRGDLNGDGFADILWRNTVTGENCIWYMNGVTNIGGTHIPQLTDSWWRISGVGDFNSDGHEDIVWRHSVSGANAVWFMRQGQNIGGVMLDSWTDLDWDIVGVGDLNGDGQDDLLWRNKVSGDMYGWLMSNSILAAYVGIQAQPDLHWQMAGLGDFTGDGRLDMLWHNDLTGGLRVWQMNGTTFGSSVNIATAMNPQWYVGTICDYSGDGQNDIVWRNSITGENLISLMDGTVLIQTVGIPGVDPSWRIM